MDNLRVNAYLDNVGDTLRTLPAAQRAQGLDEAAAVAAALRQFGQAEQIGRQLQQAETKARQPRLWPLLLIYTCSVLLIFGLLATANDKPTDFPATLAGQLVLALALPSGMLIMRIVDYLRARKLYIQG